ncbi:MAG: diguanylate cyclase [Candidatus Aminicenantes bacterium]|nr:diguanylate cyclase [Candidatus Aminicenantes bacterium]
MSPHKIDILILNKNRKDTELLGDLACTSGSIHTAQGIVKAISLLESMDFNIIIADQALAHYSLLKGLFRATTSVLITGETESQLEELTKEWPPNRYTDYVISPIHKKDYSDFFRALNTAIEHSILKIEVKALRDCAEINQIEMTEAFAKIKEIKSFVNESIVSELEKRIVIEAKYNWFKKEKKKFDEIIKKFYIANDITNVLDVADDIKELVKAQSISIYLLDVNETLGEYLKPLVWDSHILTHPETSQHTVLIDAQDFAAHTALKRKEINTIELDFDKKFSQRYKEQLKTPLKSILSLPIMHDTQVIGVLEVYNKSGKGNANARVFTAEDEDILRKISEHISIAITKLKLIQFDALTGLLRPEPFFEKVIQKLQSKSNRQQEDASFALVMGDVDWFKNYNDRNGHEAGNTLLRDLATVLKSSIREEDLLCRYGGEEFLFFLTNISSREEALTFTERIRENVEAHYFDFQEFQPRKNLTMSFGITNFTKDRFESLETTSRDDIKIIATESDMAMAEAKGKKTLDQGEGQEQIQAAHIDKNRICIFYKKRMDEKDGLDVIMPYKEVYQQEKRRFKRHHTSTIMIYQKDGPPNVTKTLNLSLGGVKIGTVKELSKFQTFDLILLLGNKACQCRGHVVYSEKEKGSLPLYHSGLKFGDLSLTDRQILDTYFASIENRKPELPH